MARKRNDLETVQITISTTPGVEAYLKKLVATGLYGKNTAEAAERLIADGIETRLDSNKVLRQPRGR